MGMGVMGVVGVGLTMGPTMGPKSEPRISIHDQQALNLIYQTMKQLEGWQVPNAHWRSESRGISNSFTGSRL